MENTIQILHRYLNTVLHEHTCEDNTIAKTVNRAIESKANLRWANLRWADLRWADLSEADLSKANLRWANLSEADLSKADLSKANLSKADLSKANLSKANLRWANLSEANLRWADLSKADLSKANLRWANLSEADLSKADLSKANLSKADLSKANLSKANLRWANLSEVKNDFFEVLKYSTNEITELKDKIKYGKVNGSVYEGECCCLLGTIAVARKCKYIDVENIKPDSNRPIEIWFLQFKEGDTPQNSQALRITFEWIEEFEKSLIV